MKKYLFIGLLAAVFFDPSKAFARLSAKAFNEKTSLTAGQLFLNQVDTVSLYLKTANVVYVPRLTEAKKLSVELVLLGRLSAGEQADIKSLAMRHIHTFNKTLKERLEFYTPKLAKDFDFKKDVTFRILVGAKKEPVALWQEGEWNWIKRVSSVAPKSAPKSAEAPLPGEPAAEKDCKKKCPALLTHKSQSEPQPEAAAEESRVEESTIEAPKEETPSEAPKVDTHVHQGQQKKL